MCSKKYTKNTQIKNIEEQQEQQEQHVRVTSTDQTMCVCSFASVFERTSGFLGDGSRRISWFLLFCASRAPSAAATCAVPRHGGDMWRHGGMWGRGRYASHEARCGTVWQSMAWQGDQQQFHLWKTQKTQIRVKRYQKMWKNEENQPKTVWTINKSVFRFSILLTSFPNHSW